MQVQYSLCLPRDAVTVPIARRLCRSVMEELGFTATCLHDVALAVTEACSNVIEHSSNLDEEYEVSVLLTEERCEIRVIDMGRGFDHASLDDVVPDTSAEGGRGIQLMRALVDNVDFESRSEDATVVRLEKRLHMSDHSPLKHLEPGRMAG